MNLTKLLKINGHPIGLSSEEVRLNLFTPGRALFVINSEKPVSGIVSYSLGHDPQKLTPFFLGYIESSTEHNEQQQRVFCRELTATLNTKIVLSLRGNTLTETLQHVGDFSGLTFVTSKQPYATRRAPTVYWNSNGYHFMDSLANTYGIEKHIWQQQGDGKIFVGSYKDSFWNGKKTEVETKWFSSVSIANKASLPAIPKLRPGIVINDKYLIEVRQHGNMMDITLESRPWSVRSWKN